MDKLLELFNTKYIVIPTYMFKIKNELKLDDSSFLTLMYIINLDDKVFNPMKISADLNKDIKDVLIIVDELCNKKIINIEVKKSESGIMKEYINTDLFINKFNNYNLNEINKNKDVEELDIFKVFEKELGRTISPMEYEFINAWINDAKYSEEVIIEALKEAVMNGVNNLKYIDKILYEWEKKGVKNKNDVENIKKNFREKKEIKVEKKEVFDYNWLDDDDE